MKKSPLYKSFGYAFQGIWACIRRERNIKIHLTIMSLVIISGCILRISITEWLICLILFAQVLSLEIVNTAIEACVDLVSEERRPLAKLAKDAAAGAVLISAIFAAIIGLLIFVPKVFCPLLFTRYLKGSAFTAPFPFAGQLPGSCSNQRISHT